MTDHLLLINPALNPASQNKVINEVIVKTLPTSLGVLAGYLEGNGLGTARIVDEQIDTLHEKSLHEHVLSLDEPRIVGLSVLTINSKRSYELASAVKSVDPRAVVVLGGIHPTVLPDEALSHESVDVVVRGEGERTLEELVRMVLNGEDWSGIQGISLRKNGRIVHNEDRPLIEDLDEIPSFPFHIFKHNKDKYAFFGGVFTNRGCPFNCIFCSSRNVSGKRPRYFSLERILSEIRLLVDTYHTETIWLMDDNISVNPKRFMTLLDMIINEGLHEKTNFHGSLRGDAISIELLEKVKKANFKMLAFGLETTQEPLMKAIQKGETVKQVIDAIQMTSRYGIDTATTLIFGLPGETRKDRWDSIRLVSELPISSVRFNTLIPYPGTPSFSVLQKEGKLLIKKDWENFAVQYLWESDDIPYVPDGNNRYELMFDTMFANLYFYLSIRGIKRMLRSSFAGGNVISLKKRWFLSPGTMWRLFRVFLYLGKRFVAVTIKMLIRRSK